MRILGVDPGLRLTGYGCIDYADGQASLVEAGVIRIAAPKTAGRSSRSGEERESAAGAAASTLSARLAELDGDFRELLGRLKPDAAAVESIFAHPNHPATAIIMGHARGVLLLAIRRAGVELVEYKPNLVKKAVTGHGLADKGQIQAAVQTRFGLAEPPSPPDVADALALALCAAARLETASEATAITGLRRTGRSGPRLRVIP